MSATLCGKIYVIMTLSRLLACSLCLTAAVASAEEYWASGIYQSDGTYYGWYDVNKTWDGDDNMCYAASASNLIAWWQAGRLESGLSLPSGVPNTAEAIWGQYKGACIDPDSGGASISAINWWLSGVYTPANPEEAERHILDYEEDEADSSNFTSFSGYYYDQYSLTRDNLEDFFDMYGLGEEDSDMRLYTGVFADLLEAGAGVSLAILSDYGSLAHAVTLWGAEYTDEGVLSMIWLTDSDDDEVKLFSVDVAVDENDKIYLDIDDLGYADCEGVYIDQVYAIFPSEAKIWAIPEPSYAILPLITLAGLLVRRRRK